ncbi:MAG: indolepyruvate oxidoreductase subunit beta [Chloroflexi bacterium]|nr:indolepyruvate oxidoreductase subunit beta [Chloroflexota bacterium]
MKKIDLIISGVGGQGVILASDIIGEVALAENYDVKKTDTLGMAQRGGSVISHVRIADKVWSPLVKEGDVDILLAFEKLEAVRWIQYLNKEAVALVNNQTLPPLSVSQGIEQYPDDETITRIMKKEIKKFFMVDGVLKAQKLGNLRTLNVFMLGCVSIFLPMKVKTWHDCIISRLPSSVHQINIRAFTLGRKELNEHLTQS